MTTPAPVPTPPHGTHWTRREDADLLVGERNPNVRLSERKIADIREAHADGVSIALLSRLFRVSRACIRQVVRRKTWRHLP